MKSTDTVSGHLSVKKGYIYMVLCYYHRATNAYKRKWIATHLRDKGNRRKAEGMLKYACANFDREKECIIYESEIKCDQASSSANVPSQPNIYAPKFTLVSGGELSQAAYAVTNQSENSSPLLADFMLEWLDYARGRVENDTFASYNASVKGIIVPYFRDHPVRLNQLLPIALEQFYNTQILRVKANTVKHYHAHICSALNLAVAKQLIPANPALSACVPSGPKFIPDYFNDAEMSYLLERVHEHPKMELVVSIGGMYGLRRSETLGTVFPYFDFVSNTFTIRHVVTESYMEGQHILDCKNRTKSSASVRSLPIIDDFKEVIVAQLHKIKDCQKKAGSMYDCTYAQYLCVDELGVLFRPGWISEAFPAYCKKIGLKRIRFHDLRHSCASILLAHGITISQLQAWLGHSHYSTTANIYAHIEKEKSNMNVGTAMQGILSASKKEARYIPAYSNIDRLLIGAEGGT